MDTLDVTLDTIKIPTYGLGQPEKHPLFFEKRVYQGSCGKVYPLPFIDKVYQDVRPEEVSYQSARLENEYVRLVMLPEIGGRIFLGQDKVNEDYDFFYRQDVIKPALVGLAGPWISGGVEFNWPQHHRPGTYLPTDVSIERGEDGSGTVWMSELDPLNRLKGMHGIRLRPGSSLVELRARLYNRTPLTHTFLWWANVAARVHDNFQSFFPPDVNYVADHAVRAQSSFPIAENSYYGVDYANRSGANDLSLYRNIPVPTSYMVCQTDFSFFGGYDYDKQGGFVHVANRHISPGKKQWTWGNHEFGWAWDRELTDHNGPYVELMAGVYTDNQPDFTYLLPYETKTFSQYWWPYKKIGPLQEANVVAGIRLVVEADRSIHLGLVVSERLEAAKIVLKDNDVTLLEKTVSVSPDTPWVDESLRFEGEHTSSLCLWVFNADGKAVIGYRPVDKRLARPRREVATEPPMPEDIDNQETLYLTGEHLELYRHPTRYPEAYWEAALSRDPADLRSNIALGRKKLYQGCFEAATGYFKTAIDRLTFRHPNPETGQAHYFLGVAQRYLNHIEAAYTSLYKATWNFEWRAAAYYELGCIDMRKGEWALAKGHLENALETNATSNKTQVALAICCRKLTDTERSMAMLKQLLQLDPLDHWALAEQNACADGEAKLAKSSRNDAQTALDIAFDYASCGCYNEAVSVLDNHHGEKVVPVAVPNPLELSQMTWYTLAWCCNQNGDTDRSAKVLQEANRLAPDYCFPSRIEEQIVLEWVLETLEKDRNAAYGLGNYYFDRKRHQDAIAAWELARDADSTFATVHRNLGIAYWNQNGDGERARIAYLDALACDDSDARLVVEYSQLCEKLGDAPESRLEFLENLKELVLERDDACVELATLYNLTHQPQRAFELLTTRSYHPWEGGEGKVLRQYTTSCILLGRLALETQDAEAALQHFEAALKTPERLGEKYHLLQAKADVLFWQARALQLAGREVEARERFVAAANESGDFQQMAVTEYSDLTYYKAMAMKQLGECEAAAQVLHAMVVYVERQLPEPAKIDYFATSLPHLLVFEEDIQKSKNKNLYLLLAYAYLGLGNKEKATNAYTRMIDFGNPDVRAIYLSSEIAIDTNRVS